MKDKEVTMSRFDHEGLDVYHTAIEFLGLSDRIISQLPRGRSYLKDQLGRAALSITANTAEGAGEFKRKEKARFYRMACRSATECAAIVDVCRVLDISDQQQLRQGRELLLRIVSMLTKLAKLYQKKAKPGTGTGTETGT
jgi:four helix bundle protein